MSLSIADFQKISNGVSNAGSITLTSSGKLDKVNNHVGILKGFNNRAISAAKTLEVKNAFVNALKNAGVDDAGLASVREELGLQRSGGAKSFDMSSLKPLSRAQTREILDRFAGVINDKAKTTVISNRWEALKTADSARYQSILDSAAAVNQKTAETIAAAQKELGMAIVNDGAKAIPSKIRNSSVFKNELSPKDQENFKKTFTFMLLHGGSDVDSIAADAMKKILISKFGSEIQDSAKRDTFKGLVLNQPAKTDLSQLYEGIKFAMQTAKTSGVKSDFACKFTAKDETPVELHKMKIIENANQLAIARGEAQLDEDEITAMMDQLSQWDDIEPGRLKNFEAWVKKDVARYVNTCIDGLGDKRKCLEFDEKGVCLQFGMDCYRSEISFGETKDVGAIFYKTGRQTDSAPRCEHFCKVVKDVADRKFISALMNQATIATMISLNVGGVQDPDDKNSKLVIDLEPKERKNIPQYDVESHLLGIMQPLSATGCRYDLVIDEKENTATLKITTGYDLKTTSNLRDGMMGQGEGCVLGKLVSSYEIKITGLGSGNPQIDSVGLRQEIESV